MTVLEARDTLIEIQSLTYIAECVANVTDKGMYHTPATCLITELINERCDRLDAHHKSLAVTPPPIDHVHQEEA